MSGARPWLRSESIRAFSAGVPERHHPALAGRELLVGVEAEDRRIAAPPDGRAVRVPRAERLAGVLDDPEPVPRRDLLERGHVGGVAEDVHRQQRPRALGHRGGRRLRVEVQRHRVDVREDRPRALVQRGIRRGDEREGARDDLVAALDADRAQREVQPGRPARDRARVRRADARGERPLELHHARPQRELPRAQHLEHGPLLGLAQHGAREWDDRRRRTTRRRGGSARPPPAADRRAARRAASRTRASPRARPRRPRSRSRRPRSCPTRAARRRRRSARA